MKLPPPCHFQNPLTCLAAHHPTKHHLIFSIPISLDQLQPALRI
jgi:hypothetical protein